MIAVLAAALSIGVVFAGCGATRTIDYTVSHEDNLTVRLFVGEELAEKGSFKKGTEITIEIVLNGTHNGEVVSVANGYGVTFAVEGGGGMNGDLAAAGQSLIGSITLTHNTVVQFRLTKNDSVVE